ncbi:hypothetical protein TrRE_jg1153 [Triparma retinervis]|uniref:Photolyase/cryptochrome alpha/beta domain-containing protein n=1 Tax=Triparma retinervis TaxID=2557542 RepID=A0A9W7DWR1_9STRA|nr:hypothetical protein TrRE_jg1153 [Triparma retinervis]
MLAERCRCLNSASADLEERGVSRTLFLLKGLNTTLPHNAIVASLIELCFKGRVPFVVTDETFVDPYLTIVERLERNLKCPVIRVDGSTVVPPRLFPDCERMKAWQWENKTRAMRAERVQAATRGEFDGVRIKAMLREEDFEGAIPRLWKTAKVEVMDGSQFRALGNMKEWVVSKMGGSSCSGPMPCEQTFGSTGAATRRWERFLGGKGLENYAKKRNDARFPHNVSRMSCYLNLGVVSIFPLVSTVLLASSSKMSDEILKWREGSYLHCMYNRDYKGPSNVPHWARSAFGKKGGGDDGDLAKRLENCSSPCKVWNSMQSYLLATGELHNNVRMTWGRQAALWLLSSGAPVPVALEVLCRLNDRYALDGYSPPSYGGVLWCFGWGDKPGGDGGLKEKRSGGYKMGEKEFKAAKGRLVGGAGGKGGGGLEGWLGGGGGGGGGKKRTFGDMKTATITGR